MNIYKCKNKYFVSLLFVVGNFYQNLQCSCSCSDTSLLIVIIPECVINNGISRYVWLQSLTYWSYIGYYSLFRISTWANLYDFLSSCHFCLSVSQASIRWRVSFSHEFMAWDVSLATWILHNTWDSFDCRTKSLPVICRTISIEAMQELCQGF